MSLITQAIYSADLHGPGFAVRENGPIMLCTT